MYEIAGLILLTLACIPEITWRLSHDEVKRRHEAGDTLCGVRKTWWGYRVCEYGECDL